MDKVWSGERYRVMVCFVDKCILTWIAGSKAGPDRATTTVGEDVSLSLRAGGKVSVRWGNGEMRKFAYKQIGRASCRERVSPYV